MKSKITIILLLILAVNLAKAQDFKHPNQLLDNEHGLINTFQGFFTKMSANGNCIITTSLRYDDDYTNSKIVLNIFTLNGTNFTGFAGDFYITTLRGITASMVDVSNDCKTISVTAPYELGEGAKLLVYTFNGNTFSNVNNDIIYGVANSSTIPIMSASNAISGDGKIIIAGNYESTLHGTLWVYSFDGIAYQNVQTITSSFYSFAEMGVDISSDGNTIAVGSSVFSVGQASIYKLSAGTYNLVTTIQPTSFLGTNVDFGARVALSNDGNILAISGLGDSSNVGAVWCYTFNGSNYIPLGDKIIGNSITGKSFFGETLALSDDGATMVIGGPNDNPGEQKASLGYIDGLGAAWVYSLSGSGFQQVGNKITPPLSNSTSLGFGYSVSASANGSKIVIGAPLANVTVNGVKTFYRGGIYVYMPTISGINQPLNTTPGSGNPSTVIGGTLNVDDHTIKDEIIVAPNPNQGYLQVTNKSGLGHNFCILNLTGEILYENKLTAVQNAYHISLPQGLYLIKFDNGIIKKLIVEK